MQLMVHIPLVNVDFPPNTIIFYNAIIDIVTLNILPFDTINKELFKFGSSDENSDIKELNMPLNFQYIDIFEINLHLI